jgi:four helix bundle protein
MEKIKNFKQLLVWKKGIEIVKEIYFLTKNFPKEENFGLTSQMRRAAVSIPANIAEGFKRNHRKEFKQFLHIALGSAAELETLITISGELELTARLDTNNITEEILYESRMLSALINKLKY